MAHCEKYKMADTAGIFIHYERTPGHPLSNKDIDSERTHLNYNMAADDQPLPQKQFLVKRLGEIRTNGRKNQNVMCDWIVTQPQDVRPEDSRKFFMAAYDFLADKYGRQNVISSYVHMDEIGNTPHMHFCFIPVEIMEDGSEKLNAKAVISRTSLQKFHPELQKAMDEAMGYHVSITTGETKAQGGNKTVKQLKEETEEKKKLPQGKKKRFSNDISYTAEESEKLHELAADGIAYRIEKREMEEDKKYINASYDYVYKKKHELLDQELILDAKIRDVNDTAFRMGLFSPEDFDRIREERLDLKEEVKDLRSDIQTIAENVGSAVMKEIPVKRADINYESLPEGPSENALAAIRKYISKTVTTMMDELRKAKEALDTVFKKVLRFSYSSDDHRAGQLLDEVRSDITSVSFSSLRKETADLKPDPAEISNDDTIDTGRSFHL